MDDKQIKEDIIRSAQRVVNVCVGMDSENDKEATNDEGAATRLISEDMAKGHVGDVEDQQISEDIGFANDQVAAAEEATKRTSDDSVKRYVEDVESNRIKQGIRGAQRVATSDAEPATKRTSKDIVQRYVENANDEPVDADPAMKRTSELAKRCVENLTVEMSGQDTIAKHEESKACEGQHGYLVDGEQGGTTIEQPTLTRNTGVPRPPNQPGAFRSGGIPAASVRNGHIPQVDQDHQDEEVGLGVMDLALAEARAISIEELTPDLPEANAVDQNKLEQRIAQRNKELWVRFGALFLSFGLIVAIVLAIVLRKTSDDTASVSSSPTNGPSVEPSAPPTPAPTTVLDALVANLQNHTIQSLEDPFSAQSRAYDWLLEHQNVTQLEEWRKQQLFALATFFYAFEGEFWPESVRSSWLDDTKPECFWFSNEGGYFTDNGTFVQLEEYDIRWNFGIDTCNEKGEYQSIVLDYLGLQGRSPTVPPEIGLLTSLVVFACESSNLTGPLTNLLPQEFYQLPNLQRLDFAYNALSGTIPGELSQLSNLTELQLYGNYLAGTIPMEITRLTNLSLLYMQGNHLTGTLHSDLGRLTNLIHFIVYLNSFSGTLPTQLGLLSNAVNVGIDANAFEGSIPSELGLMTNLTRLWAHDNLLTGTIPLDFSLLASNGPLTILTLENNKLSGMVSDALCSMGELVLDNYDTVDATFGVGINFDCSSNLCGCSWCPCGQANTSLI